MSNPLNALIRPVPEQNTAFRWAVVEATDPLRVRIETESSALEGKPSDLVGDLAEGDRVYMVIHNKHAVILGRAGG